MRKWLDDNYTGRVILAEACQPPIDVRKYFGDEGDEFHMGYAIRRTHARTHAMHVLVSWMCAHDTDMRWRSDSTSL
jgi:hypothetical protein